VSRSARLIAAAALAATGALLATALPASADGINLAWTSPIAGTDCHVTVGTYLNTPNAYPGTPPRSSAVYGGGLYNDAPRGGGGGIFKRWRRQPDQYDGPVQHAEQLPTSRLGPGLLRLSPAGRRLCPARRR
jgi:hypothetical protein